MHVDEYQWYITRIKTLDTEVASLKDVLKRERASFDEVADTAEKADKARQEEREAAKARIRELEASVAALEKTVKRYRDARWIPGVIGGGGVGTNGDAEGFVGLGWKIDLGR
jgi:chromosome segregation ATPase